MLNAGPPCWSVIGGMGTTYGCWVSSVILSWHRFVCIIKTKIKNTRLLLQADRGCAVGGGGSGRQTPLTSLKTLSNIPTPPSNQTYTTSLILSTKTSSHNPSSVTSLMSIYSVYTRIPQTPPNFAPLESPPPFVASLQATSPTPFETNLHPTFFPTTTRSAFLMAATLS